MIRTFKHSITGSVIRTREGSRIDRLVTTYANWSEVKSTPKRTGSRSKKTKQDED